MASLFKKIVGIPSFIRQGWRLRDELDQISDKVVIAKANANGSGEAKPLSVTAKARHAGMVYNYSRSSRYGHEYYTKQEYDMSVIANAIDTDSYFRRAVEKYIELIWKSGYKFIGKNTRAVNYLRKRLEQIALVTSIPTEELLRQISYQLVTYGNTYVSKVRDQEASGGRYRRTFTGQLLAPVAGYFIEDTVSIQLAVKENGEPIGYKQYIAGTRKAKIWRPWNIIHMFYSRKPGLRVGTPLVWPVLDDIRALRKMEQNVELLVFQHTIPLFQYKIGTPERPAQDEEISATQAVVEKMPPNGCIVTPERHEILAVGVERKALDATKYLEYFKTRVLAGLGMSAVGMGEGETTSKGSSLVINMHMHNTTETFQRVIKMFVNDCIIKELLLEGGYSYDAFDEDNKVELFFPPVNKEAQFEKENHYAQMYTQHSISESEMRAEFGRDPVKDEQREDMFLERVAKTIAIINAPDESYTETTKSTTVQQGNTKTTTTHKLPASKSTAGSAANKGVNKDRPANQYGRALAKPTVAKNDELYEAITGVYDSTRNDVIDTYLDYSNGDEYSTKSLNKIKKYIFDISKDSIRNRVQDSDKMEDKNFFVTKTGELMDELYTRIEPVFTMKSSYDAVSKINSMFESSRYRLSSLYGTSVVKDEPEE